MDKQKKPQQTSEEEVVPEAPPAPLKARSPYRPLSRRRRQEQPVEPLPAVGRPAVSRTFDASPTKLSSALAKAGASPEESVLVWKGGRPERAPGGDAADTGTGPDIEILEESEPDH